MVIPALLKPWRKSFQERELFFLGLSFAGCGPSQADEDGRELSVGWWLQMAGTIYLLFLINMHNDNKISHLYRFLLRSRQTATVGSAT